MKNEPEIESSEERQEREPAGQTRRAWVEPEVTFLDMSSAELGGSTP